MRGHIRKKVRNGRTRYYVMIELEELEPDPVTGRRNRRRRSHGGYDRKKDAQAALDELISRRVQGVYAEPSSLTVGAYLDQWFEAARSQLRQTTWHNYRQLVDQYVIPELGPMKLNKLEAMHLDSLYAKLMTSPSARRPEGLSPRTVRYTHAVLHKALLDAVKKRLLSVNPADFASPPKQRSPEMRAWRPEEALAFLAHTQDHRLSAAFLLALTTGARKGELLGARWSDLDAEARRLSIRQTLVTVGYKPVFSEPKTPQSRRSIALDEGTVRVLRAHRARQSEERLAAGPLWDDHGLIFCASDGRPLHPDRFDKIFRRLCVEAKVPQFGFHALRHTAATLLLSEGVNPKVVAERLGHSSIRITLDTYSHVLPTVQEEAAEKLGRLLQPKQN